MSWPSRRKAGAGALLLLALALPSGCGFRPLYGERADAAVPAELARTRIAVIPNESGQILRNHLIERLNPDGRPTGEDYVLNVALRETAQELAVRQNATVTRANLVVVANYSLTRPNGDRVTSGAVSTITSYNILRDEFATLSAERSARERALRQISEDLRTRLALFFTREG